MSHSLAGGQFGNQATDKRANRAARVRRAQPFIGKDNGKELDRGHFMGSALRLYLKDPLATHPPSERHTHGEGQSEQKQ